MQRDRVLRLQHALLRVHDAINRATGGRANHVPGTAIRFLFLTTTGRRSGEPRRVALLYAPDPDGYVVIATNFGNAWNPAWWLNLEAHPAATVEVRKKIEEPVVAERITDPDEYQAKLALLAKASPLFRRYRARVERDVPIVRLRRG
ncbi:MAG: nitroreductase family deazaflavin-dependent oxidoreductase [Acidimicrobiia bacterium]